MSAVLWGLARQTERIRRPRERNSQSSEGQRRKAVSRGRRKKTLLDETIWRWKKEIREYSEGKQVTFVEWAEFSQDEIPFNHIKINVTYEDDDSRKYSLEAFGDEDLLEGLR